MKNYINELDTMFLFQKDMECAPESKMEFLGQTIFDFTTDDGEIDVLLSEKMVDVLTVILNRKNYEYQNKKSNYINYLMMVNMPFLKDKLDYGTSIRGAWFDDYSQYEIDYERLIIPKMELTEFIRQLLEWVKMPITADAEPHVQPK